MRFQRNRVARLPASSTPPPPASGSPSMSAAEGEGPSVPANVWLEVDDDPEFAVCTCGR